MVGSESRVLFLSVGPWFAGPMALSADFESSSVGILVESESNQSVNVFRIHKDLARKTVEAPYLLPPVDRRRFPEDIGFQGFVWRNSSWSKARPEAASVRSYPRSCTTQEDHVFSSKPPLNYTNSVVFAVLA
ncbi:hypothetical protein Tco_0892446 [Tanacetum coccineum]|uniref:Uncharacterized protein n=1 Tax=Tanacetum coccineum TaxID=301880 RepID=A0ABQ5CBZ2_9ASTR